MLKELSASSTSSRKRDHQGTLRADVIEVSFILVCSPSTGDPVAAIQRCIRWIDQVDLERELIVVTPCPQYVVAVPVPAPITAADFPVRFLKYHIGCGESKGLRVGIESARGRNLVVLPSTACCGSDNIHSIVQALRDGVDCVVSVRPHPAGLLHRVRSQIYNWLCCRVSGVRFAGSPYGMYGIRREVLEHVPLYGDLHLFMPMLAVRQGFAVSEITIDREMVRSPSAPPARLYVRRILDLLTLFFLTRFTEKPFRLFGSVGALLGGTGGLIGLVLVIQRTLGTPLGDRPMLILGVLLMVIGVQVMSLGLLGELIIYLHSGAEKLGSLERPVGGASDTASTEQQEH